MKPIVELKNIYRTFGEGEALTKVLKGVNLKIYPGEFVAIMGPSGSGKSTLMYQIGLLDKPTSGEVYIKGEKTSEMDENKKAELRRKTIGFVFQQFNLIPTLTVLENVEIPMILQNLNEKERKKRAKEILKSLGLGERLNYYPTQLSGGEQQRVAIARSLANNPELILADEPTGNLDTKSGQNVMEILKELNKKGKTIIFVTHDPNLAKQAQRIVHIRDGEIIKD